MKYHNLFMNILKSITFKKAQRYCRRYGGSLLYYNSHYWILLDRHFNKVCFVYTEKGLSWLKNKGNGK